MSEAQLPLCPSCNHPIKEIVEVQTETIKFEFKDGKYKKVSEDGDSEGIDHVCACGCNAEVTDLVEAEY